VFFLAFRIEQGLIKVLTIVQALSRENKVFWIFQGFLCFLLVGFPLWFYTSLNDFLHHSKLWLGLLYFGILVLK